MEAKLIDIVNKDQTKNKISLYHNGKKEDEAVYIIFPAMGVRASYYEPFAIALATEHKVVVTADLRGNGHSSIRPSKNISFGYADMLDQDYTSIITTIKKMFPENPLYLIGHSLGGQLAALYIAKYKTQVDGLILIASCSVYYKAYEGMAAYKTLFFTQLFSVVSSVVGYFPGKKIGFGDLEAKGVMKDWSQQARSGNYILANDDFDFETAMSNTKTKILAISFEHDDLAPQSAIKVLYGKFKQAQTKHVHLDKDEQSNKKFNHFNWVKNPRLSVQTILGWELD